MKKIILSIALMICAVCAASAQSFNAETRYVGVGLSLGDTFGIPTNVIYEQAVADKIGVGGIVTYAGESFYGVRVNNLVLGVRGNYHFLEHIKEGTKWDTYAGLSVGYSRLFVTGDGDLGASDNLFIGGQVGARYCFNDTWAVYGEYSFNDIGEGYTNNGLALGVTFSF